MYPTKKVTIEFQLREALGPTGFTFDAPTEPTDREFEALIGLANAERRDERLTRRALQQGSVWALEKDSQLLAFDIEDKRGKIRKAVPFWPAKRYVCYVLQQLQLDANAIEIDFCKFVEQILYIDLASRRIFAACFWLPGKRTSIEPPRRLAKGLIELLAWRRGKRIVAEQHTGEEYQRLLKEAYSLPMKQGPKGKLP